MVHHKDKKAAADSLDTAAGCMAVDKEDAVLASADFVAGGDCADLAKTVHTAAHFHMAAAVSYTHLDVYKRQDMECTIIPIPLAAAAIIAGIFLIGSNLFGAFLS